MARHYNYRYEVMSEEALVQQVVNLVAKGYRYYTFGRVKRSKSVEHIDRVLLAKFGIAKSPSARARAKARGEANVMYLRCADFWVMLATKGRHVWKDEHVGADGKPQYFDFREKALEIGRYAVSSREDGMCRGRYRVRVVLNREAYKELKALYLERAKHWQVERIGDCLLYTSDAADE